MLLDFHDEQLCSCLNNIISGLLPHEQYKSETFGLLYPALTTLLKIRDVRGVYFAIYTIFEKYFSLQNMVHDSKFAVRITRQRFSDALSNNLPDLVLEPQMNVQGLMNEEGKSGDITVPTIQNEAMGIIYDKTMALYDDCFELARAYEDAISGLVDLQDAIKANIIETGMQMQRAIVSTGLRHNRRLYRGSTGWLDFTQQLVRDVSELGINTKDDLDCTTMDILPKVEADNQQMAEALAEYGIPLLDDKTPMLRHRFVVLVAKENVGKTQIVTHLVATMIRAGIKPYFACGESQPQAIFMRVVSSYIYQEYGMHFEPADLTGKGYKALDAEDQQIVQSAKARVAMSGMVISNSLEYDNVIPNVTEAYNHGCEAFFIDHSQSLRGRRGRPISELVTTLALDCRELKINLPIYIMLTSHPSTDLKDILQKEQTKDIQKSPTAQSSTPSTEADEVFILNETDYFSKQNILQWLTYKRRGALKPQSFFIRKLFHVASYQYDPNIQSGEMLDANELATLVSTAGISADEDDIDDEDNLTIDFG